MIPDITPMPDQEAVRNDAAHTRFHTKIDLSDTFEQICVCPEHKTHTVFTTIYSNMYSRTMQQGDKNCPATFQRLMDNTFSNMIGVFIHCYQDDIFVYFNMLEECEAHLHSVFDRLREHMLFLSSNLKKIDLLSTWMDCLGFFIDDEGIHLDPSKIDKITEWRMPRNYHDIQKFTGIIQYIAQFLPNVTDFTSPLTGMCSNNWEFIWTAFQDECFNKIKELVAKAPACWPIDSKSGERIWVISDASATSIGAWYGQGPTWDTCRPAGFISRKFMLAQMNYCTWEQELLGVLEALLRWEDKLLGLLFTIVTDHQALTFFNEAPTRSQRCMRWWEYISWFNFKMQYLKGEKNKVTDSLSRYFANKKHNISAYVNADTRLDPEGEDLTIARMAELFALKVDLHDEAGCKEQIRDHVEPRTIKAEQLSANKETSDETLPNIDLDSGAIKDIFRAITRAYKTDCFFSRIWKKPSRFNKFRLHKNLLWMDNRTGNRVVCVPNGLLGGKSLRGVIIDSCHQTTGHSGLNRTTKYIRKWFWWPSMADDIEEYCKSCGRCQTTKTPRQKPQGWLHTMPIPSRPWESIGMDFTGPFVEVGGYDYILLLVRRMTGMVHLIPTHTDAMAKQVAETYVKDIMQLHGILKLIVSDRDTKFTSQFWRELSWILSQRLLMSTSYHPQTDGSSEWAIQVMSQMLCSIINDQQTNWVEQLPLVEFAMNSAENKSTGATPFEANYGWLPRMIRGVEFESSMPGIKQFMENITNIIDKTFDQLLAQRTKQAIKANCHRQEGQNFQARDLVLLSTKNLKLPKGRTRKLCPKYIGPYKILWANPELSTYKLELLPDLRLRKVHNTFHEKLLKAYINNNDKKFPKCKTRIPYDIGNDPEQEWVVEAIEDHKWSLRLIFKVHWAVGDTTWEPLHVVDELEALDHYLELEGVSSPSDLRRRT